MQHVEILTKEFFDISFPNGKQNYAKSLYD